MLTTEAMTVVVVVVVVVVLVAFNHSFPMCSTTGTTQRDNKWEQEHHFKLSINFKVRRAPALVAADLNDKSCSIGNSSLNPNPLSSLRSLQSFGLSSAQISPE